MGVIINKVETRHYINGTEVSEISVDRQIELIGGTQERIKYLEGLETKTKAITEEISRLKKYLSDAVALFNA